MINRVVLVGRLVKDPELRKTNNGTAVASFSVAVDNWMKDQEGKNTASYFPCTAWGNTADAVFKIGRKGMLVGLEGRLNQRHFVRKDNTNASVIEIVCDSVQFLESKAAAQARAGENPSLDGEPTIEVSQPEAEESGNLESTEFAEDDMPF